MSEEIGFIGLGLLGLPMATNLVEAGHSLRVYNRTASKAEPLLARGAHPTARAVDAVTTGESSSPFCGTTLRWRASSRAMDSSSGSGPAAFTSR